MVTGDATHRTRVLLVDDEALGRRELERLLTHEGFEVRGETNGATALAGAAEFAPDIVVTDLKMPVMDGIELLQALRAAKQDVPVIVATGCGKIHSAVDAMRAGAEDYVTKPIDFDALLVAIRRAVERRSHRDAVEGTRRSLREVDGSGLQGLLGTSSAMQAVFSVAKRAAASRTTVLITGETGTGKGELAVAIHALSPRATAPFVALHCSSLAESLLESELFGHEKGAFTGADRKRVGRFEQADGGTLFLDEIGEVSPLLQVKLLRVLQERTFERVGGSQPIKVDVRLVAATHRDLAKDVHQGRFRADLYYRLNVITIDMPPLRLRGDDAIALAEHFLQRFAFENHSTVTAFSATAKAKIAQHSWPGNVRALENAIERAVVLSSGAVIDEADLTLEGDVDGSAAVRIPGSTMAQIERHAIEATLKASGGSTIKAAAVLDLSVRTVQYRLHTYGAQH